MQTEAEPDQLHTLAQERQRLNKSLFGPLLLSQLIWRGSAKDTLSDKPEKE